MAYKMLVLDLDDTLLNDEYCISERNKKCLIEAQQKGIYVVLASGRPTSAMMRYSIELELANFGSYMISYNGAIITDLKNNKTIFEQSLTKEEIHDLHDFSINNNLHIITYKDDQIISESESEYINIEQKITGMPILKVPCFKSEIVSSAVKCILLQEPIYLKDKAFILKAQKKHLSVAISKPFFLEVMPKGIDKAASLHRLAGLLNIKQSEIIAIGNAENDLSMIEYAGLGIWVDNVTPDIRDKANAIVASNNNDGVAQAVEQYIFNRTQCLQFNVA